MTTIGQDLALGSALYGYAQGHRVQQLTGDTEAAIGYGALSALGIALMLSGGLLTPVLGMLTWIGWEQGADTSGGYGGDYLVFWICLPLLLLCLVSLFSGIALLIVQHCAISNLAVQGTVPPPPIPGDYSIPTVTRIR